MPIKPAPEEKKPAPAEPAQTEHNSAFARFQSQQRIAKQAFVTAQNLLQLQKNMAPNANAATDTATTDDAAASAAQALVTPCYYSAENVMSRLTELQSTTAKDHDPDASLLDRVRSVLPESDGQLKEDDINTIDITENFFRAMTSNPALQDKIKPNIKEPRSTSIKNPDAGP